VFLGVGIVFETMAAGTYGRQILPVQYQ